LIIHIEGFLYKIHQSDNINLFLNLGEYVWGYSFDPIVREYVDNLSFKKK